MMSDLIKRADAMAECLKNARRGEGVGARDCLEIRDAIRELPTINNPKIDSEVSELGAEARAFELHCLESCQFEVAELVNHLYTAIEQLQRERDYWKHEAEKGLSLAGTMFPDAMDKATLQARVDELESAESAIIATMDQAIAENTRLREAIINYMRWEGLTEQGEGKDDLVECFLDEWQTADVQTVKAEALKDED